MRRSMARDIASKIKQTTTTAQVGVTINERSGNAPYGIINEILQFELQKNCLVGNRDEEIRI